ncbi:MAG: GWxTD domain-containing protein [Gemmatimonadales bacterium]
MVRGSLASLVLLAHAARVLGQAPGDRLVFDQFRDSLSHVEDTTSLRILQHQLHSSHTTSEGDTAGFRACLVALRLGELGADGGFGDAIDALKKMTARHPEWPYAWYALGQAEIRRAAWERSDPLALGNRVGVGTLERASGHLRRSLEADSSFDPAALALSTLTLGLRDTALYPAARDALRRAATAPSASAELLLALGRMERAAGEPGSAAVDFERALAAGGASRPLALLELARTRLALGRSDGEGSYYEGAAVDDSATVAGYRADLVPIATEAELATFDQKRGAARAEFLRGFWTDRDRLELRADGERLREHYRRLLYARRNFALTITRRFYADRDAYRSGSEELDDRGIIYVRHGEPAERHRPFVFGLMPNESWRYARAEGDLLFHFTSGWDSSGGGDLYDYRLVESVLDLRGADEAPRDQLLLSRQSLSPLYGRMLNWGPNGAARSRAHERGIGRASIAYGTTSDSYELQFERPLLVAANLVAVGSRGDSALAHFVFAVGEPGTRPDAADPGSYPIRVRLVILDGADHPLARIDTTFVFRLGEPLRRGQYLIGRAELPLPPGLWGWRAAVQQGSDAGVVLRRDSVRVATRAAGLALSDIALGVRDASALWLPSPGDTVHLTPFDLFREGGAVELYYELTWAAPGDSYRHRIAVFRLKENPPEAERRPVVTLAFEERATDRLVRSSRTLQLGRLKPGRYVVEVQVTDPTGASVTRRRVVRVVARDGKG